MTKKELLEELKDIPDDYIICGTDMSSGEPYELTSIATWVNETYYDKDDEPVTGNFVQF